MKLGDLIPVVKIFGTAGIFGGIMLLIMSEVSTQVENEAGVNSTAYNATQDAIRGGGNLMEQLPIIGTIIGLVILLGIVINSLLNR